ncbi:MAG: TAXI family TRAP transporter solute-binding subunit [Hoeflea sp.]|uniref:TAXI family TRAP transporter solute-binding subunit n=1 Tax=Hoeflea sp. TaxID=1940281 RepID=UPI003EF6BEFD
MRTAANLLPGLLRSLVLAVAALMLVAGGSQSAEFERNIMTGGPTGTYIRIGKDIAALGGECGLTLNVIESAGSLENFVGVRNRRNTQFGIVQSDLLEYLKTFEANDPEVQDAVRGVRIMFPLYNEEVHVLARTGIASLKDLEGKKIAIDVKDSGTFLTASLILDILQVEAAERLPLNPDQALPKLQAGDIDAFFYVAGAPALLFANAAIDPVQFHLLPITEAPLLATYIKASIPAGTYGFQTDPVDVVAVKAVLMTYDYDPNKNAYHRQSCTTVSDFSSLVLNGMDKLRETGHPKWQSVDLSALPPGWQVGSCVKAGMALDYAPACTRATAPAPADSNEEYLNLLKQRLKN